MFEAADSASLAEQSRYIRTIQLRLLLMVIAGTTGVVTLRPDTKESDLAADATMITLIASSLTEFRLKINILDGPVFVGIRLVTLATTVAALLPAGQGAAVPWTTFQLRCRRAFVLSSGFVVALAVGWLVIGTTIFPLNFGDVPTGPLTLAGLTIAGTTVLAAAYFAGVRYIPLLAGGAVAGCGVGFTLAYETELAFVFGLPGLLVLGGFYWQLRRVAERPPRFLGNKVAQVEVAAGNNPSSCDRDHHLVV